MRSWLHSGATKAAITDNTSGDGDVSNSCGSIHFL